MREIKFRAWYKQGGKYVPEGSYIAPIWANRALEKSYVIEQFTGLRDKNGKEIYEGDIVEHDDEGCTYQGMEVVIENGTVCFPFDFPNLLFGYDNLLVIGNIHENPELLK